MKLMPFMKAMNGVHVAGMDLNLLLVLEDLLRTCSVTRTAKRLGRTQSAVSHALRRLRSTFGDPLFVRVGAVLQPTARARELAEPLHEWVYGAHRLMGTRGAFEPARLRRRFTLAASDFAQVVLFPRLLARLAEEAPGVDLRVVFVGDGVDRAVQSGEVDLALGAGFQPLAGLLRQTLFEERNVCLARKDHPRVKGRLTLEDFVREPHADISPRGRPSTFVDEALAKLGRERRVVLSVPHFVTAPLLVARSDLLLVAPARVAAALAGVADLQVLEPPLPLPGFLFLQVYAEAHRADPAHAWLRALIAEVCAAEAAPALSSAGPRRGPARRGRSA
jgi:DNA-binding transcriptional LysR family regulator